MSSTVTQLLKQWESGDADAIKRLIPQTLAELKGLAGHILRDKKSPILQPTELVNEAYIKLVDMQDTSWRCRVQFFACAAKIMRNILADKARRSIAQKRDGSAVTMVGGLKQEPLSLDQMADLDEALDHLAEQDQRKAVIVELRFYGGLNHGEIAEHLSVSEKTIKRDWQFAKVWLFQKLNGKR